MILTFLICKVGPILIPTYQDHCECLAHGKFNKYGFSWLCFLSSPMKIRKESNFVVCFERALASPPSCCPGLPYPEPSGHNWAGEYCLFVRRTESSKLLLLLLPLLPPKSSCFPTPVLLPQQHCEPISFLSPASPWHLCQHAARWQAPLQWRCTRHEQMVIAAMERAAVLVFSLSYHTRNYFEDSFCSMNASLPFNNSPRHHSNSSVSLANK